MACKEDQFTQGGRTYLIRQMPPRKSIPVQLFLTRTLGRPLFEAFSKGGLSGDQAAAVAVGLLSERLDDATTMDALCRVFSHVGIKDEVVRICDDGDHGAGLDVHFQGSLREMWAVFGYALYVNYADFFVGPLSLSNLRKIVTRVGTTTLSDLRTQTSTSGGPASPSQSSAVKPAT